MVLAVEFSPTFLNTGTTDETLQQSGKQETLRHILENSGKSSETLGSQFFRATTGTQSMKIYMNKWMEINKKMNKINEDCSMS